MAEVNTPVLDALVAMNEGIPERQVSTTRPSCSYG